MTNHVHLIIGTDGSNKMEDIIRDYMKYTSVRMIKEIENNTQESRKDWMLWMLRKIAEKSIKHQKYSFWQNSYHPVELSSKEMAQQKLE